MSSLRGAPIDHCSQSAADSGAVCSIAPVPVLTLESSGITWGARAIPDSSVVEEATSDLMGMYKTVDFRSAASAIPGK